MFNKQKVTILEQMLDERDAQIETLKKENADKELELQRKLEEVDKMLKDHEELQASLEELRQLVVITKLKNVEYARLNRELKNMKKSYEKEMTKFMSKLSI